MIRLLAFASMLVAGVAGAQEPLPESGAAPPAEQTAEAQPESEGVKTLSGMSILGNEEAPKSLVIVPWKSSRLGDEVGLTDAMDDSARPVDKEVFMREVHYYGLRAGGSD